MHLFIDAFKTVQIDVLLKFWNKKIRNSLFASDSSLESYLQKIPKPCK